MSAYAKINGVAPRIYGYPAIEKVSKLFEDSQASPIIHKFFLEFLDCLAITNKVNIHKKNVET
jgi:hypothetical protein